MSSVITTTSSDMPFIVSYNPDSETFDVLQKSPFRLVRSFTYEEDAFNYAKQLESIKQQKK
jgi:hypothetical protein